MIRQFATKRDIISAFANTLNLVSPELLDRNEKVSYLAYRLAQTLDMDEKHRMMAFDRLCSREAVGMSEDEYKMMRIAGYLHDLGKMKIPDEIPDKPGRLTEAEYISALTEERPYRKSMEKGRVVAFLSEDTQRGLLSNSVVDFLIEHDEKINKRRAAGSKAASKQYQEIFAHKG